MDGWMDRPQLPGDEVREEPEQPDGGDAAGVEGQVPPLQGDQEAPQVTSSSSKRSSVADGAGDESFMSFLDAELDKLNAFFVEKEEDYVTRTTDAGEFFTSDGYLNFWTAFGELLARDSEDELMKVRKETVDFHGEMVLLENYSALNFTGLVKILKKKYDKRTGALIRLPFIQKVLQQPFFTTDLLYELVKDCEAMLDRLFPIYEQFICGGEDRDGEGDREHKFLKHVPSLRRGRIREQEKIEYMEGLYMKSTIAAFRALKEIRSGSSTV